MKCQCGVDHEEKQESSGYFERTDIRHQGQNMLRDTWTGKLFPETQAKEIMERERFRRIFND